MKDGRHNAGLVRVHRTPEDVVEVFLDRADALNALSTALIDDLCAALGLIAQDDSVRAVVLASTSERAFCAGADLRERQGLTEAQMRALRSRGRRVFTDLAALPVPVVASLEGLAVGGGYELALNCDRIVAGATCRIGLPEARVGLIPGGGGTQLVRLRAGSAVVSDLLLTGRQIDAREALALGLVDRVVDDGGALTAAREWATLVTQCSPSAVRAIKRVLRETAETGPEQGRAVEHRGWEVVIAEGEWKEGVDAFVHRRPPAWLTTRNSPEERSSPQ